MKYSSPIAALLSVVTLFILTGCGADEAPIVVAPTRTPKIIQTQVVGKSIFDEQFHVTGRASPYREVTVSTQGTGFIGSIAVDIGDRVSAGQSLASIADTYGLSGNTIEEANIGIESANLSRDNTLVSLQQSLESARINYERAQKDYNDLKISDGSTEGDVSKAELDFQNYITVQEQTLLWYETSYQSQLQSFQSFLANIIDTTDKLLGISEKNQNVNDSYEHLLGALNSQTRVDADNALRALISYKNWSPDPTLPLLDRVAEMQKVYMKVNTLLAAVENMLINSVPDETVFPNVTLVSQRSLIDSYQTQYTSLSSSIVSYLNTVQSFLAIYQKERLSRERGVQIAAANSQSSLDLAKKAYETAQKALDIGIAQSGTSLESAQLRLRNAQWSTARLAVTAPFSGVVIARDTEVGELASPGMNLFTIGDTSRLLIKTDISVDQKRYLRSWQAVSMILGGETFTGTVVNLAAGPDAQTHLYKMEIQVGSIHPEITLGDIVDVILPGAPKTATEENKEIVIPFSALKNLGQETYAVYVFSVEDAQKKTGTVHERIVKIGEMNETSVVITDGLALGESIVAIGTLSIEDGDYVQEPWVPDTAAENG